MAKITHAEGNLRSDDKERVTELMARIVEGDEAALFTLVDEFDSRVAYNVRQIVTDMGRRDILADEDDGLITAHLLAHRLAQRLAAGALANGRGQRTAFHYRGARVSFAQVREDTGRFAGVLAGLEVAAEQRVLIALPDTPAFLASFLGTIWHGSVAVPINPYLPLDRYEFFLRDSRAVVAIVPPWLVCTVIEVSARLPALQHIVVFCDPGTPEGGTDDGDWKTPNLIGSSPRLYDAADLLEGAIASPPASTNCDEPAFWLYTSGSTGLPKGAIHLHHDIWVAADCWGQRTMGMRPNHVHL